jgi:hypothetical protein
MFRGKEDVDHIAPSVEALRLNEVDPDPSLTPVIREDTEEIRVIDTAP